MSVTSLSRGLFPVPVSWHDPLLQHVTNQMSKDRAVMEVVSFQENAELVSGKFKEQVGTMDAVSFETVKELFPKLSKQEAIVTTSGLFKKQTAHILYSMEQVKSMYRDDSTRGWGVLKLSDSFFTSMLRESLKGKYSSLYDPLKQHVQNQLNKEIGEKSLPEIITLDDKKAIAEAGDIEIREFGDLHKMIGTLLVEEAIVAIRSDRIVIFYAMSQINGDYYHDKTLDWGIFKLSEGTFKAFSRDILEREYVPPPAGLIEWITRAVASIFGF